MTDVRRCLLLACALSIACTEASTELLSGLPQATVAPPMDGGAVDSGVGIDGAPPLGTDGGAPALCRGGICECDNGRDEDGDGLIDGLDPECTGPFDDDESSFATGTRDDLNECQDCFWDHNAGSGDDGCRYPIECLSGQTPLSACSPGCEVSAQCVDNCRDRTPNGCDCFGCCEIRTDAGQLVQIVLSNSCATEYIGDEQRCPTCTLNQECMNPCGRCELCPGKRLQDLPADCPRRGEQPGNVCDEGPQVCSETEPCMPDYYCLLGCCQYVVQ